MVTNSDEACGVRFVRYPAPVSRYRSLADHDNKCTSVCFNCQVLSERLELSSLTAEVFETSVYTIPPQEQMYSGKDVVLSRVISSCNSYLCIASIRTHQPYDHPYPSSQFILDSFRWVSGNP